MRGRIVPLCALLGAGDASKRGLVSSLKLPTTIVVRSAASTGTLELGPRRDVLGSVRLFDAALRSPERTLALLICDSDDETQLTAVDVRDASVAWSALVQITGEGRRIIRVPSERDAGCDDLLVLSMEDGLRSWLVDGRTGRVRAGPTMKRAVRELPDSFEFASAPASHSSLVFELMRRRGELVHTTYEWPSGRFVAQRVIASVTQRVGVSLEPLADLDGDGLPDVVCVVNRNGPVNQLEPQLLFVSALGDVLGTIDWPCRLGEFSSLGHDIVDLRARDAAARRIAITTSGVPLFNSKPLQRTWIVDPRSMSIEWLVPDTTDCNLGALDLIACGDRDGDGVDDFGVLNFGNCNRPELLLVWSTATREPLFALRGTFECDAELASAVCAESTAAAGEPAARRWVVLGFGSQPSEARLRIVDEVSKQVAGPWTLIAGRE